MAYDLFRFLKDGVNAEELKESTDKAFEGKLPEDPSQVEGTEEEIERLTEKELKIKNRRELRFAARNKEKVASDVHKGSKFIEDLEKQSPGVDKLTQGEDGLDPNVSTCLKKRKKVKETKSLTEGFKVGEEVYYHGRSGEVTGKRDGGIIVYFPDTDREEWIDIDELREQNESKKIVESVSEFEVINVDNVTGAESDNLHIVVKNTSKNQYYGGTLEQVSEEFIEDFKNVKEGKLPDNPANIEDPKKEIQQLSEERVLTTVSDEEVAKDLITKYPGSRYIPDEVNGKKQFIIMVKEAIKKEDDKHNCSCVKDGKCTGSCKEGVEVTIVTDDKEVNINSQDGATQVTTTDKDGESSEVISTDDPVDQVEKETEEETEKLEAPEEEQGEKVELDNQETEEKDKKEVEQEEVIDDEDDTLVAEKIYVSELLKVKKHLTEKEHAFINEVNSIKLSEARKLRVDNKVKALKFRKLNKKSNTK